MYVTKYALTRGILTGDVLMRNEYFTSSIRYFENEPSFPFHPGDYFDTEEEAVAKVEKMKAAKIQLLQKSLTKFKDFTPKIVNI
jgi:carotenoid cleavage dioxygenase-like enzyme